MSRPEPMELDNPNEIAIVNGSKSHLLELNQENYLGMSTEIYQFSYNSASYWNKGHTFIGNNVEDLSFQVVVEASNANNKREATFLVHETDPQFDIKKMMKRSLSLKHDGIMRPLVVGYNTQFSKVISAFWAPQPILTLVSWLEAEKKKAPSSTYIPPEVRQLLGTAYKAIAMIWQADCTSDSLADPCSYHMIGGKIKIDPLCIRDKRAEEKDEMLIREAFGTMILKHIYCFWNDNELKDFVDLLNYPNARVHDILEAPILLLPDSRELLYHTYDNAALGDPEKRWLNKHAKPQDGWKNTAGSADPILQTIMDLQIQHAADFSTDFQGAMHFGNVVTAHYPQHFRKSAQGRSGAKLEGRVDAVLKLVLPGLLTKRYNCRYRPLEDDEDAQEAPQLQDDLAAHQAAQL